jgi:hypothetical protein
MTPTQKAAKAAADRQLCSAVASVPIDPWDPNFYQDLVNIAIIESYSCQ